MTGWQEAESQELMQGLGKGKTGGWRRGRLWELRRQTQAAPVERKVRMAPPVPARQTGATRGTLVKSKKSEGKGARMWELRRNGEKDMSTDFSPFLEFL